MQILTEKPRAPELRMTEWLQGGPLALAELRGRVILLDFWDYACVNCLHTLPYLKSWHQRYESLGLTIIGIHAPEFQFAQAASQVRDAVQQLEIPYSVALDNQFLTWSRYACKAWPTKFCIDAEGRLRAVHQGEGAYSATERLIQTLLAEINPKAHFPVPMTPVQGIDRPGALCLRATPELYCGWGRGVLENGSNRRESSVQTYCLPDARKQDTLYLEGVWRQDKEFIEPVETPAKLYCRYQSNRVNVVLEPTIDTTIQVLLDGEPVLKEDHGQHIDFHQNQTVVKASQPGMYELIHHQQGGQEQFEEHELVLAFETTGVKVYAFTFVGCVYSA